MKVLHVLAGMDPRLGGVCQAVRTMAIGLTDLKVTNEVVSLDPPGSAFLKDDPFLIHALGPARGPWSYSPLLLPWLVKNICLFDIIIVHGLWVYCGHAVKKAFRSDSVRKQLKEKEAKGSTTKLFVMPHGMLDPYFQRAQGRKLKAIRNVVYWAIIEGDVINSADGLLFTCEEEMILARQPFNPYRPKRELVVGLGVEEPPAFTSAMRDSLMHKAPDVGGAEFLLFLSRIHPKKGVDLLIKAFNKVKSTLGGSKLVIAGPGLESAYGAEMKKLADAGNETPSFISFPGMLSGDSKWGAFYCSEAFVLPSHQENFGIAVVEALACGKPVLISNQVNIWREIVETGSGIVAEDTEEGSITLLSKWSKLSRDEKITMGRCARKLFETNFAVIPAANRLLDALRN